MRFNAAVLAALPPGGGALEILSLICVFIFIVFLAYAVTRFAAKRASGRLKGRHMEVVDTLAVGVDAQLLLVKAGECYFLLCKSQKQLTLLTKVDGPILSQPEGAEREQSFAESLKAVFEGKLNPVRLLRKDYEANGRDPSSTDWRND